MIKGLVSIIMPVYNGERYLAEAIQSVLSQQYTEWELLIIDNGSTDKSPEILRSIADSRIRPLREDKKGVSHARNKGLSLMRGEFFCFLDCDDCYTATSISSRIRLLSDEPGLTFADGCVSVRNADFSVELKHWCPAYCGDPLEELLRHSPEVFFGPTWMFRRNNEKTYRFNPLLSHGEDLYFYIEHAHGGQYGFTRETILQYRVRPGQASSNLRGMETGYRVSGEELKKLPHVGAYWQRRYTRKAWSITWKSYAKAGKWQDALRVFLNPAFKP